MKSSKYILLILILPAMAFSAPGALAANTSTKIPGLIVAKGKLSQEHKTTNIGYNLSKAIPMGGAHHPGWATCKAYTTQIAAEYAIHSMEHGAIWIAYDSSLKGSEVRALTAYLKNDPFILLTPVNKAPNPITVTAWGFQLKVEKALDPRIKTFIKTYKNSKTTPELGAPCQGGISDPIFLAKPRPLQR